MNFGRDGGSFRVRIDLEKLKFFLIFLAGFFLPWGNELKSVSSYSPYFFFLPVGFLSFFIFKTGLRISIPTRIFISFILFHVLLTSLLLGQEYLGHVRENFDFYKADTTHLTMITKLFSFIFYFLVLISVILRRSEILALSTGFVFGLASGCALKLFESIGGAPIYRFAGPYHDPNAFAISSGMAFFLCLLLKKYSKSKLFSLFLTVFAWLFPVMVLLTQSRGGLLALILAVAYFLRTRRNFIKGFVGVIIAVVVLFPLVGRRVTSESWADDSGGQRLEVWGTYLSHIEEYFLTGTGLGRSDEVISTVEVTGKTLIPHNIFLEVLVEFGILGFLIFLWILWFYWARLKSPLYKEIKPIAIAWGVGVFFISAFVLRETWFAFVLFERAGCLDSKDADA